MTALAPEVLSAHVDEVVAEYDRTRDLAGLKIPGIAKIDIAPPGFPDDPEALSKEQLRTSLILYALQRALRTDHTQSYVKLRRFIRAEERIRCDLLTHEAKLKQRGQL